MGSTRISPTPRHDLTIEQARDVRARTWAYVFSCWQAKQQDMSLQTPRDHPNDSTAKEVNHVEQSSDETSNIVHHPFTKENE